jgi:hypothetical protein
MQKQQGRRQKASALSACRKSLTEFAPAGANKVKSVFHGGVYGVKNTSRPANVRVVRCKRTTSALRQAAAYSKKWQSHFFDNFNSP